MVTPTQIRTNGEPFESRLIKIIGVTQVRTTNGVPVTQWTTSGSGTNYRIFVGTDSCDIRIYTSSNIANKPIPPYPFNVVALNSQFCSAPPYNTGYQIIPRDTNDFSPTVTDIQKISNEIPYKYNLFQNFPNPFNPTTEIKYGVVKTSKINIKVYDILGNEVTELVNSIQGAGTYEVTFGSSSLSSGVYFYTLFADGNRIDSKKMLLSK